ncbi:hypothetical protein [Bradyrhizobium erythrophlei]|uniref:Uncharacterized protein n=1 Tax=Bradyrhizobium erythrophlei TaxID=1437360 RepID=A0A1M7U9V9_9BRAD|nr:hypothetical protein [Bradyrhizobium erythrophlei]SHN79715.1 hypothetical protein SAMN05444170_4102 [Bradyrhizobium erythrophlei]
MYPVAEEAHNGQPEVNLLAHPSQKRFFRAIIQHDLKIGRDDAIIPSDLMKMNVYQPQTWTRRKRQA